MIKVKQISSKKDKKKFFKFLIDLYKGNPHAAPNLYSDEFSEFDPEVNDAFRFCECKMFLAYEGKKIVGRIAAIWHKGVNEKFGTKQLRFTRFDVIDDFEVTKALFAELYKWAKELGMEEIIGPMSFSDLNEEGMLIDGFDRDSMYIELYNYPYYVEHMEKLGAYKVVDWNCYRIKVPEKKDERLARLSDVIAKRNNFKLVDIAYLLKHDKKKLNEYVMQCMDVLDEAFAGLYGTSPLNEKQKKREMNLVYMALLPELAAIVEKEGEVVAYGFMMPSMLKVLQKARGNVFPRGIIPYIKAMKKVEVADMMSIGVRPKYNNKGAVAMVMNSCLNGLHKLGVKYLETGPELEENDNVQNLWKNYERELAKRHRCWGLKVE
ncbi:MAG: N-acetyltransferase [Clostridia bacterium]|nr:N-acetyltransferase [Clostridia bacterium]